MSLHPLAGTLPAPDLLVDIPALIAAYYTDMPDAAVPAERIAFGTSGHRGSSLKRSFNEAHILAMTQAVCELRRQDGVGGPLYLGMDTHALSEPAFRSALEVLAANDIPVLIQTGGGYTPTPVISHAILNWNRTNTAKADGIVITPSHNAPADGGFKYNPPHGGPADTAITARIEKRANALLADAGTGSGIKRLSLARAKKADCIREADLRRAYVADLGNVLNMPAIAASGLRLGADPLGGATVAYWEPIAETYGLNLVVVNKEVDPTFRFIPLDHDGTTRMDCSSPYAMATLLRSKDNFDLAFGCDPDSDRHGIVTPNGLMNPNHYLSVAAWHLLQNRPAWPAAAGIGKTVVTSSMLNRVGEALGRPVLEVPVGFKWFVPYLFDATCGLGCEESAGASCLRFDATPWSTDKDGPLLCLLAAEIAACHGASPSDLYQTLTERFGAPAYARVDSPLEPARRARFASLSAASLTVNSLAGSPVTSVLTQAPANQASIGGIKIISRDGWFAARPSGTEPICKVYTESFLGEDHRKNIEGEAVELLNQMLDTAS
ncbi:MAG: phosphoglucomutase (alpha-D-glucose-1,6-bisphosphate-dependent) [Deltaproteobacteria bacterium]|jgi:phosphoglucomutase|nr:phosphoglucomutase (alpha-D-glucose-1,6-bisphosphate-dependent) [Deltaproteobacteria bacterium]